MLKQLPVRVGMTQIGKAKVGVGKMRGKEGKLRHGARESKTSRSEFRQIGSGLARAAQLGQGPANEVEAPHSAIRNTWAGRRRCHRNMGGTPPACMCARARARVCVCASRPLRTQRPVDLRRQSGAPSGREHGGPPVPIPVSVPVPVRSILSQDQCQ